MLHAGLTGDSKDQPGRTYRNKPQHKSTKNPTRRSILAGGRLICVSLLAGAFSGQYVWKETHALEPDEFTSHPERQPRGPVAVIVSLSEQLVHVYDTGLRIAVSTCSTGKTGYETPTCGFVVLQNDRDHRPSTHNIAPMPNTHRPTCDGIALRISQLRG